MVVNTLLFYENPPPLQLASSLYFLNSIILCWHESGEWWAMRWLSCSSAWLIIAWEWGAGVIHAASESSKCHCHGSQKSMTSTTPPPCLLPHLTLTASFRDCSYEGNDEDSCRILELFHFHSRDRENRECCISSCNFQYLFWYPKGGCFNAYLLILMSRKGTFYSRAMECWIKWWFSFMHTREKKGFRRNNSLCIAYLKAPQSSCCSHNGPVKH